MGPQLTLTRLLATLFHICIATTSCLRRAAQAERQECSFIFRPLVLRGEARWDFAQKTILVEQLAQSDSGVQGSLRGEFVSRHMLNIYTMMLHRSLQKGRCSKKDCQQQIQGFSQKREKKTAPGSQGLFILELAWESTSLLSTVSLS